MDYNRLQSLSTTEIQERISEAIDLFNNERFEDCQAATRLLFNSPMSRLQTIYCVTLISSCKQDWYEAEEQRYMAESLLASFRFFWPAGEDTDVDDDVDELREILDNLREDQKLDRPDDYKDNREFKRRMYRSYSNVVGAEREWEAELRAATEQALAEADAEAALWEAREYSNKVDAPLEGLAFMFGPSSEVIAGKVSSMDASKNKGEKKNVPRPIMPVPNQLPSTELEIFSESHLDLWKEWYRSPEGQGAAAQSSDVQDTNVQDQAAIAKGAIPHDAIPKDANAQVASNAQDSGAHPIIANKDSNKRKNQNVEEKDIGASRLHEEDVAAKKRKLKADIALREKQEAERVAREKDITAKLKEARREREVALRLKIAEEQKLKLEQQRENVALRAEQSFKLVKTHSANSERRSDTSKQSRKVQGAESPRNKVHGKLDQKQRSEQSLKLIKTRSADSKRRSKDSKQSLNSQDADSFRSRAGGRSILEEVTGNRDLKPASVEPKRELSPSKLKFQNAVQKFEGLTQAPVVQNVVKTIRKGKASISKKISHLTLRDESSGGGDVSKGRK